MRKIIIILITIIIVVSIVGILTILKTNNRSIYPNLSEKAIAFHATEFIDDKDDSGYLVIEYNGRKYMPYGTIKRSLKENDIEKCIGYLVQDENTTSMPDENNTDTRIYSLTEDKENNFLMEYYIGTTLMNQPSFWRAIDTKGKDIVIPDYIDLLDYTYWK